MAKLKLDTKDRIILTNQFKILAKVDQENKETYERAIEILANGFELEYDIIARGTYEPVPESVCREVHDILEMFEALDRSYKALADKSGIDDVSIKFNGFDGNNEDDHLSYAQFLKSDGRYPNSEVVNSHSQVLEGYQRMVAQYKQIMPKHPLEKADIQKIVAARTHPSRR